MPHYPPTFEDAASLKPSNRQWWIGSANYGEAGTTDRWAEYEDEWVAMRRALGFGLLTVLPFAPPFDSADAGLTGEFNPKRPGAAYAQGGERFYGFQYEVIDPVLGPSTPINVAMQQQINNARAPKGSPQVLFAGGVEELYAGELGLSFMPDPHEPVPWERTGLYQ